MVSHMDEVLKVALDGPLTPIPPTPDADFDEVVGRDDALRVLGLGA